MPKYLPLLWLYDTDLVRVLFSAWFNAYLEFVTEAAFVLQPLARYAMLYPKAHSRRPPQGFTIWGTVSFVQQLACLYL